MNSGRPDEAALSGVLKGFPAEEIERLAGDWTTFARPAQLPPDGDWTTWLLLGGRGAGKTRAGAEWIRSLALAGVTPLGLVGETMTEAIEVMVRGESGIMRVHDDAERPVLRGNALHWPNGAEALVLPASDPERFRGPQFAAAWCDEIGKWPHAEEAWDMLQFGLRLGDRPRQLATTTPRPTRLIKRLMGDRRTAVTRMPTSANQRYLAPGFLADVVGRYAGTVLGRQELEGELIEDMPGALWTREMIKVAEVSEDDCERVVVAIDPPATSGPNADACGIVVAGRRGREALVLADMTIRPAPPLVWADRAIKAFRAFRADRIVAEVNQGGEMVKIVLAQVDASVPVRSVHATRGKYTRAEPVAALYAQGRVIHRPGLTALEDEMCSFGGEVRHARGSPDRVDALVWALTELMLREEAPRLRPLVRGV